MHFSQRRFVQEVVERREPNLLVRFGSVEVSGYGRLIIAGIAGVQFTVSFGLRRVDWIP
jgi:hypothetical protein